MSEKKKRSKLDPRIERLLELIVEAQRARQQAMLQAKG